MSTQKWLSVIKKRLVWIVLGVCVVCLVTANLLTVEGDVLPSGSREWSRGVVVAETTVDVVGVAAWEETTFVAWMADDGQLKLTRLGPTLEPEGVTGFELQAAYPRDVSLEAVAADRLHVAWLDSLDGVPTLVHAEVAPGRAEPYAHHQVALPNADHVDVMLRPEGGRIEVFWSESDVHDTGVHHLALLLSDGQVTPDVPLTEEGWMPAAGQGAGGVTTVIWLEQEGRSGSGFLGMWGAPFDPQTQSLAKPPAHLTDVRVRRGYRVQQPDLGTAGDETVVAWTVGRRTSVGLGTWLNPPTHSEHQFAVGLSKSHGAGAHITSDWGMYVMVTPEEESSPILQLTTGDVVEIREEPRVRTAGDRSWATFSSWVARRSDVRMQIVVVPFGAGGARKPQVVNRTRSLSTGPDLAVGDDGTLRLAWLEPQGDDRFRIAVASTGAEALQALGGFRPVEALADGAQFIFEVIALLGYAPVVLLWVVPPLAIVAVATVLNPEGTKTWQAAIWLGVAVVAHMVVKHLLAPQMLPLTPDQIWLSIVPLALGTALMVVYWRLVERPMVLAGYGVFLAADALFSLYVIVPRLLWY